MEVEQTERSYEGDRVENDQNTLYGILKKLTE